MRAARTRRSSRCPSPSSFVIALITVLVGAWALFVITHSVKHNQRTAAKRGIIDFDVPHPTVVHTLFQSKDLLHGSLRLHNATEFCCSWKTNVDDWWSRSPSWELVVLNTTHQCFGRIQQAPKRHMWEQLYATQFPAVCQNVVMRPMTGSGWGIDFSHVVDGFLQASNDNVTVDVVAPPDWQYAQLGDTKIACPSAGPQCYFLPWTNCSLRRPHATIMEKARFHTPWRGFFPSRSGEHSDMTNTWLLEYATRGQTWLRREAVQVAEKVQLQTPCVAFHVRRGDVVLHGNFSRRYHAIAEYIDAWEERRRNIAQQQKHPLAITNVLLLTDDANAITETLSLQLRKKAYRWFYLRRPRHHGPEGGWENQIPSRDPRSEVVFLHAMFHLVSQCHVLVHSKSNLADYLFSTMNLHNSKPMRINLDDTKLHHQIHRAKNSRTVQLSTKFAD